MAVLRSSTDSLVLLSVLVVLVAIDILSAGGVWQAIAESGSRPGLTNYIWTAFFGVLVGFAELVSRYRDEPWRVAILPPGLVFIGLNGIASCFALFLLQTFPQDLHAPSNPVMLVLVAGTGAMVLIRSKLFTVHQPGGSETAVGPAFVLDTMLAAINRDVDRRRASQRTARVAVMAARLNKYSYEAASDFLLASLGAFQNLDNDIAANLRAYLSRLITDDVLKKQKDEIKFVLAGFSILTEYGDKTFDGVFSSLEAYLKGTV